MKVDKIFWGTIIAAGFIFLRGNAMAEDRLGNQLEISSEEIINIATDPKETVTPAYVVPIVEHEQKKISEEKRKIHYDMGSHHSLDEVMFKISRAKANLEEQQNPDFNKAIQYLQQALNELKQIRE